MGEIFVVGRCLRRDGVRMAWTSGVVLLPALALAAVRRVRLSRVRNIEDQPRVWAGGIGPVLWMEPRFREFLREMAPSFLAGIVAVGGMAALGGGSPVSAGLLLSIAVAVPAGRWPMADRARRSSGWSVEAAIAIVLMLWMANWIVHPEAGGPEARMLRPPLLSAGTAPHTGGDLSGVILTLPIKPREEVLLPPPIKWAGPSSTAIRPVRIEFDGVYWYFQAPDRRPRHDAKVVQGDPVRARIRSTNATPIQMEAHQRWPEHIPLDRYREIVVRMRDADNLPGLIRISLLLEGEKGAEPLLLGTRVLEASRTRRGYGSWPVVDEELRFALVPASRGRNWLGAAVRVEPERARAQAGAHVMVLDFLLEP